jgi:hypothetical protein
VWRGPRLGTGDRRCHQLQNTDLLRLRTHLLHQWHDQGGSDYVHLTTRRRLEKSFVPAFSEHHLLSNQPL